jgi:hypothetical protein
MGLTIPGPSPRLLGVRLRMSRARGWRLSSQSRAGLLDTDVLGSSPWRTLIEQETAAGPMYS